MKKSLFILFFFSVSHFIYGQTVKDPKTKEIQVYQMKLSTTTKTMVINTTNFSFKSIRQFKKELDEWNGKVISSHIDTIQKTFTVVHNLNLSSAEMEEFLRKYQIKNTAIISYN